MKKLFVLKIGTTFPATAKRFGDFDRWTLEALGKGDGEAVVLNVEQEAALPNSATCAGVVLTGSHAMVTDDLPWSVQLEKWIPTLLQAGVPFLGICYGHQLLARALGGEVGFHPGGAEVGTVEIYLTKESSQDPLLASLPQSFAVHATHSQTVLRLPQGAVRLAANGYEPNHAFRFGACAWGVQFHPEYSADIMRSYITAQEEELAAAGRDVPALLRSVEETPFAAEVLRKFARFVCLKERID